MLRCLSSKRWTMGLHLLKLSCLTLFYLGCECAQLHCSPWLSEAYRLQPQVTLRRWISCCQGNNCGVFKIFLKVAGLAVSRGRTLRRATTLALTPMSKLLCSGNLEIKALIQEQENCAWTLLTLLWVILLNGGLYRVLHYNPGKQGWEHNRFWRGIPLVKKMKVPRT